jgi:hypothetical protein
MRTAKTTREAQGVILNAFDIHLHDVYDHGDACCGVYCWLRYKECMPLFNPRSLSRSLIHYLPIEIHLNMI